MVKPFMSETTIVADPTFMRKLIESATTSTSRPEDILEQLRSCGIEWHITEKGALWIKYWQIGAEDFVPVEHAAALREGEKMSPEVTALEWVSRNLDNLRIRYPGKWVALQGIKIVAAADDLSALMLQVKEQGIEQPFVTQIPAEKVVWTTTYAIQGF